MSINDDWKSRPCVLATMHGKETVIAPLFKTRLGIDIIVPDSFDTDRFGTFTREIPRAGDQLEAARQKARAAMQLTGCDLGVASEGSFGADPRVPFLSSNLEIVILVDARHGLEIVGRYRTSALAVKSGEVKSVAEAVALATAWGFPEQGVIVRRSVSDMGAMYKEIRDVTELEAVSRKLLSGWFTRSIFLETDMRAHRCPARLHSIKEATLDLIENCQSACPQCSTPGFVVTDLVRGLLCRGCGRSTDRVKETIYSCQKCSHTEARSVTTQATADSGDCQWCNP